MGQTPLMNNNTQLRDYQQSMLQDLYKAWKRNQSVMVQMPTGTGKTHLMAEVIRQRISQTSRRDEGGVLIVAHRIELIEQISQTLNRFGIKHGILNKGLSHNNEWPQVMVASIQTLTRRLNTNDPNTSSLNTNGHELNTNFSLIIVDEAHHALAKTYRMMWERWPKAKFLGLTATPCRLSGEAFTDLFDTLLQSWTIEEFIDKGWLSDFEYVSASPESEELRRVASLQKRGADGDYQTKELVTVMDCPESIEHLYETYRQFAGGKKGIVYAINREHARHIADYYAAQGVNCCVVDSKTPAKEREQMIEAYKAGIQDRLRTNTRICPYERIDVLVNVDVFSEGFDCPEVEFIQLARPTLSLSKYLQQVGRGMRVSDGKPHVLILDNVGLYQLFGLPTEERNWRRTFYGQAPGRGEAGTGRYVVIDEPGIANPLERELVNLEMVRIKKGGRKGSGLEVFLQEGRYGVMRGGKVTCEARFRRIERLKDDSGYFAVGKYYVVYNGRAVELSSLIDKRGMDLKLRLYSEVKWMGGYFFSQGKMRDCNGEWYARIYWDPKGDCYYYDDPNFRKVAGVEVAQASEHLNGAVLCLKLRWNTGEVSPRFNYNQMFYNKNVLVARDYLVVKKDRNHSYRIKGFLPDSILVQEEGGSGYRQFFTDGSKGVHFNALPQNVRHSIFQVQMLGLERAT